MALRAENELGQLNKIVEKIAPVSIPIINPSDEAPVDYKGPRIGNTISDSTINEMIDFFVESTKNEDSIDVVLHQIYAHKIVDQALKILHEEKSINELTILPTSRITIIGDTHGQLLDILTILKMQGMPSESNILLFNGDFVDRGPHGVEVLLLLLALKVKEPKGIYLNRGNHEHRRMNAKYGFEDQGKKEKRKKQKISHKKMKQ